MATIGDLVINLRGDTAEFTRNMKKSAASVANVAAEVAKYGAVAGAAAVGGLALLTKESMKNIDALAKTADKLGIVTEELAGLRHAAELSGVASNTLDMALQRMTRRVSEAARGTGEAKDALKELGLDAQKLAQMAPDQAFREIAGAMEGVSTQGDKVRLAMRLFDSEGVALVNTLAMGREGLDASAESARAYGTALSRVSAAKVEAANDALFESGQALAGLGNTIAVELSPYIQDVVSRLTDARKEAGNFRNEIQLAMDVGVRWVGLFADGIHGLHVIFKGVEVVVRAFGAAVMTAFAELYDLPRNLVNAFAGSINTIIQKINDLTGANIALMEGLRQDPVGAFLAEQAEQFRQGVITTQQELHELLMQPLPSDSLRQWADEVQATAQRAAEEVAKTREAAKGGGDVAPQEDTKAAEDAAKLRAQLEQELATVDEFLMSRTEREALAYQNRQIILDEALNNNLLSHERWQELSLGLADNFQARLTEIEKAGLDERNRVAKQGLAAQAKNTIGQLADMASGAAGQSKKMFEVSKALALANAAVTLPDAVLQSFRNAGGYPFGLIPAGLMLATGLKQIASIKSATFGGGSSAPSVSGGGGAGTAPTAPTVQPPISQQPAQPGRVAVLNIEEDGIYSGAAVRRLIERINEQAADNVTIRVG